MAQKKTRIKSKHSSKFSQNLNDIKQNPTFEHRSFKLNFLRNYSSSENVTPLIRNLI